MAAEAPFLRRATRLPVADEGWLSVVRPPVSGQGDVGVYFPMTRPVTAHRLPVVARPV
jgi:hypothetical protein